MKFYYNKYTTFYCLLVCISYLTACNKKLDVKPNQSLLVPATLADFQAIADVGLSGTFYGETSADNYYLSDARFNALSPDKQAVYTWGKDFFPAGQAINDWNATYNRITVYNAVLEGLTKINPGTDSTLYLSLTGAAHFARALALYQLAQLFCKPYDSATAKSDPGVPIKLHSDINDVEGRSTVQQLYDQIISDANIAEASLPIVSSYKTRPTKSAADALLSRIYLVTRQYDKAAQKADTALFYYSTLINYNALNPALANPISLYNAEVLFHSDATFGGSSSVTYANNYVVDTSLYRSYADNDLRKSCYFKKDIAGNILYKGSYTGNSILTWFTGIATDEVYLTRAECRARAGDLAGALSDLNTLLVNRFKQGTFIAITAQTPDEALAIILQERRKELIFRGIRWSDLRRLNTDPRFAVTLTRIEKGQTYTLLPNSPRYVLPIPGDELLYNHIQQNPR